MNSFDLPIVAEAAREVAERYEACGLVDIYELLANLHSQPTPEAIPDIPFEKIRQVVSTEKNRGIQDFVVRYTFNTPHTLKQLRIFLSDYDNEIYAFRLRFTTLVFENLSAFLDKNPQVISSAYLTWLKNQEEGARYGDMGYELVINSPDRREIVNALWDDIHEPVELVEYQEHWVEMFSREKEAVFHLLQGIIVDVEHIGSTVIPGMLAKPIIDILLTVPHLKDAKHCINPLRQLGYAFIDYPQNTDRLFFRKGKPRSHHIHIVEKGSDSDRNHIHFRDALLSDETLRNEYLQLKRDALQKYKHRRALYGEQKHALIQKALAKFR